MNHLSQNICTFQRRHGSPTIEYSVQTCSIGDTLTWIQFQTGNTIFARKAHMSTRQTYVIICSDGIFRVESVCKPPIESFSPKQNHRFSFYFNDSIQLIFSVKGFFDAQTRKPFFIFARIPAHSQLTIECVLIDGWVGVSDEHEFPVQRP